MPSFRLTHEIEGGEVVSAFPTISATTRRGSVT